MKVNVVGVNVLENVGLSLNKHASNTNLLIGTTSSIIMKEPEVSAAAAATASTTIATAVATAPTMESSLSLPLSSLSDKVAAATEALPSKCFDNLHNAGNKQNALTICDYMFSLKSEINPSDNYRKDIIMVLCNLSTFFNNNKSFKEITRKDLLSFLDSRRKPEQVDRHIQCL
jgi:hypothetical protein